MGKRKVLSESDLKELVLPQGGELFGKVAKRVGGDHFLIKGQDGKVWMGRLKGKLRRRVWIRDGDVVVIAPWDFGKDRCDIVWRYTLPQVEWLTAQGKIPENF